MQACVYKYASEVRAAMTSEDCGEPLGRLEWRFWSPPAPEDSPAGGERLASPVGAQGASPFLPSSPSPASPRSLSSSMENRALKP
jgi:hypothetical protein